jgi:peptidyl-prolyl cis-trans isomerase C
LLEHQVEPEKPGDAECRRYYDAHVERFRTPDLFEAAHILIAAQDGGGAAAEQRACEIAQAVSDDPEAFAAAARAHSACTSAQQGGSLGQIRRGELVPEVQTALERLAEGTITRAPVRSRFGWHVLRLHRRIAGRPLPYEVVRSRIADMLEARSWTVASARYIAALAERGCVEGVAIRGDA